MGAIEVNVHLAATIVVAALSAAFASPVATAIPQQGVTIRGSVFDSLVMKPVVDATVWIAGGNQIAKSDSAGRFVLTGVTTGKRFVEFSSNAIDSLQLGTLGTSIDVGLDGLSVALATPSLASIRGALCKNTGPASADSGIMWGTLRDAASDTRLHGAKLTLAWTELEVGRDKQVLRSNRSREVLSDSAGNYYACGLPVASMMYVQATGAGSTSGVLDHTIGAQQLSRLDLLVSAEMVSATARGTATVRIAVRDDKGRPLAQSTVSISASDSALQTDADGMLTVAALPAGTHVVTVRKIGITPTSAVIQLRPGVVSELSVVASTVTELAGVTVKASAFASRDRLDFEDRRRAGFGFAVEAKDMVGKIDLQSALSGLPSIVVRGGTVTPSARASIGSRCLNAVMWLDGTPADPSEVFAIAVEDFRAIEWYPRSGSAPPGYRAGTCGLLLFWTRNSRWAK